MFAWRSAKKNIETVWLVLVRFFVIMVLEYTQRNSGAHRMFSGGANVEHTSRSKTSGEGSFQSIKTASFMKNDLFSINTNEITIRDVFHFLGTCFHVAAIFLQGTYWSKFPWNEYYMCFGDKCRYRKNVQDWQLQQNLYWAAVLAVMAWKTFQEIEFDCMVCVSS